MCSISLAGMPCPSSLTETITWSSTLVSVTRWWCGERKFDGVTDQVIEHLLNFSGIQGEWLWLGRRVKFQRNLFFSRQH